jgi:hypothetical protein
MMESWNGQSYEMSRRPISRKVIPTSIAEMALSRNFSGISKKALYSVPSFFLSLNFILFCPCWEFLRAPDEIIWLDLRKVAAAVVANLDSQYWPLCIHHRE